MLLNFDHLKTFYNAIVQKLKSHRGNWNQNDPKADDYIKNKPFYEETTVVNEPLNITWDGNTEGLVSCADVLFKVSDLVLTDEQIASVTITVNNGIVISAIEGYEKVTDEISRVGEEIDVVFVNADNAEAYGVAFPEAGIYFMKVDDLYFDSLTTTEPVEHVKTTLKKLDPKFLPDDIKSEAVKYVTISSTYDAAPTYTADATYAQITEWISTGLDVKCILDNLVLNLSYSSQPINGLMHDMEMMAYHFVTVIWGEEHNIAIYENGYVEYNYSSYAKSGSIPDVANLSSDWIADLKTALGLDSPT